MFFLSDVRSFSLAIANIQVEVQTRLVQETEVKGMYLSEHGDP